jgi:hydroxypyruvate reductase/glycerate 2-kinase
MDLSLHQEHRTIAEKIFYAGVEAVKPSVLIPRAIKLDDRNLILGEQSIPLNSINKIYVIGAGKASGMMALETEKILGRLIKEGLISVKYGHSCPTKYIKQVECGHPVPDENGFRATSEILRIAEKAGDNDLVVCLLSGGGSALMPDYPPGSSAEEIMVLNGLLVNCGASISEINTVRKHLSLVKGGQLARAVYPATLVNLIISDVPGDYPDIIASGPATPDPSTFDEAILIIEKYELTESVPYRLSSYLHEGAAGKRPETPKPGDPVFERTHNILIGNNRMALEAAALKASELKLGTSISDDLILGDIEGVAEKLFIEALKVQSETTVEKPVCLLFGGEPTVRMTGRGKGGRNQHLALLLAKMLKGRSGITMLCAGTDGTDGPTDAAGAVVDSDTIGSAIQKDLDPEKYIYDFDSYCFFKKAGGHIITGPTMTNVMDVVAILIWKEI